jgi:outer membrane PBP1 activator LpoA protein
VLETAHYEAARADFSDIIRDSLQVHTVKGEPSTHRTDVSFVFIAGNAESAARLIVPQLKFHYAGDIPVYATSDSFEPTQVANEDIDGLMFPDMPWMISSDPGVVHSCAMRCARPGLRARRNATGCMHSASTHSGWRRCSPAGLPARHRRSTA